MHDYSDYIVRYDRPYITGHTFVKDAFKVDYEQIVPIVLQFNCDNYYTFDHCECFGSARLEHREDGIIARCNFDDVDMGRLVKDHLLNEGDIGLTFIASVNRDGTGLITSGHIMAVSVIDIHRMSRVKEVE